MTTKSEGYSSQKYYQRKIDKLNEEKEELMELHDTLLDQEIEDCRNNLELVNSYEPSDTDRENAEELLEEAQRKQHDTFQAVIEIDEKILKLRDKLQQVSSENMV